MIKRVFVCTSAVFLLLAACGDDTKTGSSSDDIETELTPGPVDLDDIVGVDTLLPVQELEAGSSVDVTCLAHDSEGHQGPVEGFVVTVDPMDGVSINGLTVQGIAAGTLSVACALDELVDPTPATLEVRPGPPAVSAATVEPAVTTPQETAQVTCEVEDAYGNPVTGVETTVSVSPSEGIVIEGDTVSGTVAGSYEVTCEGTGLDSAVAGSWTIEPGPSLTFALTTMPKLPAYKLDTGIVVSGEGEDAWGNPVSGLPIVDLDAEPAGFHTLLGETQSTISFDTEGFYILSAAWADDPTSTSTLDIVVDQTGPEILIQSPERGLAPAAGPAMVTFAGSVSDNLGQVGWLEVMGAPYETAPEGGPFTTDVELVYGINPLQATAADAWENERTVARSVFWSDGHYALSPPSFETDAVTDALIIDLGQAFLDDGDHDHENPNDLATIMELVLADIDLSAMAPNPLTTFGCIDGDCEVHATNFVIEDAQVNLQLIEGGLSVTVTLVNFGMDLEIHTPPVLFVPSQVLSGTFTAEAITLDMNAMLSMEEGQLVVDAEDVLVDFKDTSVLVFDSVPVLDELINQGLDFIEPALLGILETALPFLVEGQLSDALSGFAEAFSFDEELELPALVDGQEPSILKLMTEPSQVFPTAKSLRLVMDGLAHAVDATRPYEVPGSPRFETCAPIGNVPTPPASPMLVGFQDNLLNQLAFAVWESGTLTMSLDGDSLGDLDLASFGVILNALEIDGLLPPMVEACDGVNKLQLGDLYIDADLILLGEWAHFSLWIQGEAPVDFVNQVDEEGVSKLAIEFGTFDPLLLEVVSNEGMFEGDDSGLVNLIGNTMLPLLLDNLAGDALAIELPAIDLNDLSPELPEGTTLNIDIQAFSRSGGFLVVDAGLK